jgi:cytochrome c-type biogenesis protein CcmE
VSADQELDQLDADGEPPEFDLTPRPASEAPKGPRRRNRKWLAVGVLVALAAVTGFVVSQALGSATEYFYRVDEAVAQRPELGTRRFRMQGSVSGEPVRRALGDQQEATFALAANGKKAKVEYTGGEPPALFKPCEPVVIVGHWQGEVFKADQIIVKHTETYTDKHPERVDPTCS